MRRTRLTTPWGLPPKNDENKHRRYFLSLGQPTGLAVHFFTQKARRKSRCHLCSIPIEKGQKVIGLEFRKAGGFQFANGGRSGGMRYYCHTGCWRAEMRGDGSGQYFCYVCHRYLAPDIDAYQHSPSKTYWIATWKQRNTWIAVAPLCKECTDDPRVGYCDGCRHHHWRINLSPLVPETASHTSKDTHMRALACPVCERNGYPTERSLEREARKERRFWRQFDTMREKLREELSRAHRH